MVIRSSKWGQIGVKNTTLGAQKKMFGELEFRFVFHNSNFIGKSDFSVIFAFQN